ncbi:GMC family oxidoreductase [Sphingomonas faeni]|uniref:GMC family oxidoreductase n=1 Tax=Sphingomonas faeni TaxID=185950 RepID=UPI00278272EC|nr:GMC family oxidoreductase N-terminal domain-containing protein [Sphingomonas faeni]MDQ0837012.1 choline dehydrogenase [Sphingomonas faeni]
MIVTRRSVLAAGAIAATALTKSRSLAAQSPADVVIVGGGSAGAVLAARLSADPRRHVVLLEAGPVFAPETYPRPLTDPGIVGTPDFNWNYKSDDTAKLGHAIPLPRGKVVGGSSAINAAIAIRARPADFARWTARGIEGWSWGDVLPAFKALENTPTGADAWHGRSGSFPIRQRTLAELSPSARAFVAAGRATGLGNVDDFNGEFVDGACAHSLNVVDGVRMNTGMVYLTADVRARPNLTIRGSAEVDCLILSGRRATGVRLVTGESVMGGEVILSGGAFGSPAILMRSGIGPAANLRALGIPVVADLPVGRRLQDHPFFFNIYALKPPFTSMFPAAGSMAWTRSKAATNGDLDLQVTATHFIDPKASPTGGAIVLAAAVTLPKSIGSFELASRDPRIPPRIRANFFDHPSDLDRMVEAVNLSREIGRTAPFAGMVDHEMAPGVGVTSDAALRANIVANIASYQHPTSTVPMGADADPTAVVDAWGNVRGIQGLRVVDASILPEIPSVPTNVTTIMVAERIAARITGASSGLDRIAGGIGGLAQRA